MKVDKGGVVALGILAAAIGILIYLYTRTSSPQPPQSQGSGQEITAVFSCANEHSITATFSDDSVKLTLSDGRELTLPHAISADGARYANSDESFVFWNKGTSAFITEGGTTTFQGCETKQN